MLADDAAVGIWLLAWHLSSNDMWSGTSSHAAPFAQPCQLCATLQGWSKLYDFNFSHLRSGMDIIEHSCQRGQPSWKALRGLLGTAIYGGIVDNAQDYKVTVAGRSCIKTGHTPCLAPVW